MSRNLQMVDQRIAMALRGTETFRGVVDSTHGTIATVRTGSGSLVPALVAGHTVGTGSVVECGRPRGIGGQLQIVRVLQTSAATVDDATGLPSVVVRASGGDDLATLQSAVSGADPGTSIHLTDALYLVSGEWHISASGVRVVLTPKTIIRASGAISGAVVRIGALTAPTAASGWCLRSSIEGGTIDTAGLATQGLLIKAAESSRVSDVTIIGPDGSGETGLLVTNFAGSGAFNRTRDFRFERITITVTGAAEGLHLGGDTASQEGTIYKGSLYDLFVSHAAGTGYSIAQCDDVRLYGCDALPSGPGYSMDFRGGANNWNAATFVQVHGNYPLRTANGVLQTSLLDAVGTSVVLASAAPFPTSGDWVAIIDDEEMLVTAGQGTTTLTVTRGYNGTQAVTHINNESVRRLGSGTIVRGTGLGYPAHDITFLGLSKIDSGNQVEQEKGGRASIVDSRGRHSLVPDERSFATWREDFGGTSVASGSIGELGWQTHGTTPFAYRAPEADRPGIGRISTDGTVTTPFGISLNTLGLILPDEGFECIWKVRLNASLTNVTARFGLAIASGAGTDDPGGIYFERLSTLGNWQVVTSTAAGGGTETMTGTNRGVYVDQWVTLRIRLRSNGVIGFSIGTRWANNQDNWQHTTNIPAAALTPFAQIISTVAAVRTADLDLMSLHIMGMDRR